MKVLICTVFKIPHVGGASTHIELLAEILNEKSVYIGLVDGNNIKDGWVKRTTYFVRRLLSKDKAREFKLESSIGRMAQKIISIIGNCNSELVIHCHDPLATCAALRAVDGKVPVIQTVHGPWSRENTADGVESESAYNRAIRKLEHDAYTRADMLLPVDKGQADILKDDFDVEDQRLRIIENAVDVESLARDQVSSLHSGVPVKYFLVPRRLVPKNGVEYVLRAFALLKQDKVSLHIAGDGILAASLKKLAEDLGISSRVCFLGDVPRDELIPMIKKSLAIIVPSVPFNGVVEATSLAVLEGMACGVPVIGSSIGGIKDIIVDDRYGILVEAGKPEAITDAMNTVLIMKPEQRFLLTENARKRVNDRFGVNHWRDSIFSVYQDVHTRKNGKNL